MKIYAILAILTIVIGLGWRIYSLGGENARLVTAKETLTATLEQLRKDDVSVEKLKKRNAQLSRKVTHAQTMLAKIQDPTGCFRKPIPAAAAFELRNVYDSIDPRARRTPLRAVEALISD